MAAASPDPFPQRLVFGARLADEVLLVVGVSGAQGGIRCREELDSELVPHCARR
jgi:hypothetical protein